jgi:hypothetical protein
VHLLLQLLAAVVQEQLQVTELAEQILHLDHPLLQSVEVAPEAVQVE